MTVDGRQSRYSTGASLQDLGSYLISKGASAAINLDGGGSTYDGGLPTRWLQSTVGE